MKVEALMKKIGSSAFVALSCALVACTTIDDVATSVSALDENECHPECMFRECGDDGCGGSCGSCYFGEQCVNGDCQCVPDCHGNECGDDGCGGSCGSCGSDEICSAGTCVCVPYCGGATCGDDGCGGSCGACGDWEYCSSAGHCVERPPPPPPACSHSLCEPGVPLRRECDACVASVCRNKPGCCLVRWDASCVAAAAATCGGHC